MATRKSAAPSKTKAAPKADAPATGQRQRADWQAIERDYRTGRFTLRELEAKHGANNATILRRAKREGWTADLSKAVRQATNAALVQQVVQQKCSDAQQDAATTVLAAAELNKQVILSHRGEIKRARDAADALLTELLDSGALLQQRELLAQILAGNAADAADVSQAQQAIAKALGIGNRVQAFKALTDAIVKLEASERIAFSLDDKDDDKDKDPVAQSLADFFSGIHGVRTARLGFVEPRK